MEEIGGRREEMSREGMENKEGEIGGNGEVVGERKNGE